MEAGTVEDMGVDHSGGDILVAEQLLNGANIVVVLQQMCGKTVPKSMAAGRFSDPGGPDG